MEEKKNDFIKHEPCPSCGSKVNLARYSDNSAYCFGCDYSEKTNGQKFTTNRRPSKLISGVYTNLEKRKISQETCKKFNYQVGKHEGNSVQIANYYDKNNNVVAQHLRYPNKDFKWLGN